MNWHELEPALREDATGFDFFQVLRRLECAHRDKPRLGQAVRLAEEPIRLGQEPSLSFPAGTLSGLRAPSGDQGKPPCLEVSFFGLLGPNGPLPIHLTEYARDRLRNAGDATFARFLDVFNHRMLLLFYRAWADAQPTVSSDRPESDRYLGYAGALAGIGLPGLRARDRFPDRAKLYFAGRLGCLTRNPEGLRAMISEHFAMPAAIEEFVGAWLDLPEADHWYPGGAPAQGKRLGLTTIVGTRTWQRQTRFRVVLGPLNRGQFRSMLPEGRALPRLHDLVQNYIGDELDWDLRLVLDERTDQPMQLGGSRLGWDAWLGAIPDKRDRQDLLLYPRAIMNRQARPAS
jgi:type VI secretion system protein ImpH